MPQLDRSLAQSRFRLPPTTDEPRSDEVGTTRAGVAAQAHRYLETDHGVENRRPLATPEPVRCRPCVDIEMR